MSVFNKVEIKKEFEAKWDLTKACWSFFIPGLNSGVYKPASLHIITTITKFSSTIFGRMKKNNFYADITLTPAQFDDLYREMTKIKELRDNKILSI